jgi:hypothetical protein
MEQAIDGKESGAAGQNAGAAWQLSAVRCGGAANVERTRFDRVTTTT